MSQNTQKLEEFQHLGRLQFDFDETLLMLDAPDEAIDPDDPRFLAWQAGVLTAQREVREQLLQQALDGKRSQPCVEFLRLGKAFDVVD